MSFPSFAVEESDSADTAIKHAGDQSTVGDRCIYLLQPHDEGIEPMEERA